MFNRYAQESCLHLNLPKTVLIPLWEGSIESKKAWVKQRAPDWSQVNIDDKGRYLGLIEGPGEGTLSWAKPMNKWVKETQLWKKRRDGRLPEN